MKLKKALSVFLALCMMLPILSIPVTVAKASADTWQSLQAALSAGGEVTLDADVTAISSDAALSVPANTAVTLDLNGHTIDRALGSPASEGSVFIVYGTLVINGPGTITGGNTSGTGGGIWARGGVVRLESGTIMGNNAKNNGGGVYVSGNGASFTANGGEISQNTSKNGGGLATDGAGSIIINGGAISGNSASNNGGGIWLGSGTSFDINGGSVTENTAAVSGGGVYINGGSHSFDGGSIIGNTAESGADLGLKSGVSPISFSVSVDENITNGSVSSDQSAAESGATVTLTVTPERGMALSSITATCGGADVTLTELGGGEYSFTMPAGDVSITAEFGENELFTIRSAEDWEAFSQYIANGEYTDEDWKLGADITVSTEITTTDYASGATVGTEAHPFAGTFDGQGHTLTVNIADTYYYFDGNVQYYNQGAAPFRYISGATIKNLTVEGTIYGGYHTAGLVGFNQSGESTIENCTVNVTFSANENIYQYIGGVLGHNKSAAITMTDVVFGGTINNSEYMGAYEGNMVGGLIGWSDSSTVVLDNCLFKGSVTGEVYRFNPVLLKNGSSTVSATLTDIYYTCEPHTVWLSNGSSSQNVINENVSRRVFPGIPENTLYEHFIGADGMNYNAPCTISGIQENYIADDDLTYTVKNYFGAALNSSYYNVNLTRNGSAAGSLANGGEYTLTLTGKNGYTGTYTKSFLVYEDVPYIALDGTTKYFLKYDKMDSDTDTLNSLSLMSNGKYVVVGDVTVNDFITVSGDVSIVLCDGATLRAKKGIGVRSGSSLTVWGQTNGTGKLIAIGEEYGAGIGAYSSGSDFYDCGTVTINGGTVDATGGHNGAGIGGIYGQSGGTVTVNQGTVIAHGGVNGAGIGMGRVGSGGTVTINGGAVTAYGGESGAGIGGGDAAGCGTVTINGGTVNAYGGSEAAAIGGGRAGSGGTVTIQGGVVTATGGEDSPGIPNDYVYDIGAKGGSTTTLTYTDDSAAGMRVTANKFEGTVKFGKVFYNVDTLARYDVTENANINSLSGTLSPAANYRTVTFGSTNDISETYEVPVLAGNEYTLPQCTFTPPSEVRPFVAWVVKIGSGSVELLQPGDTITVTENTTAYARFATEYGALQTLINNASNGTTITLDRDYVSEYGGDTVFTIPAGKAITIDLAGHTIDRGFSSGTAGDNCNVFSVYGTLTIRDTSANQTGVITGGNNRSAGGAIRVESGGTLNFESGTVTGNQSANGGGIYNIGTLNISGGLITNNTSTNSGGGIFNNTAGTLNLTGGTVTNNSAAANFHGGGIHTSGTLNVSGAPVVEGNYRGSTINNIGLYEGAIIHVTGALTNGASLGVNKSSAGVTTLSAGIITSGFGGNYDVSAFSSDNGAFVVGLSASGEALLSAPLTLTFDKGDENASGTMASVTVAPNLPYTLPACGFTAPAHKYFGGWSVGGTTKAAGEEITVSQGTTITAIWADVPYAVNIEPSVHGTILTDKNEATIGETVTLTALPDTDFAPDTLTVMLGSETVAVTKETNGTYTFVMPAGAVTVSATFRDELGTVTRPFELHNKNDWDAFAAKIAAGTATSDYYKLADDFDNSTAITTPVGTEAEPFKGHFDGNGKTLVVNINDTSAQGTAPFRNISGATIENLTVSGSVIGTTHASGLVGFNRSGASTFNHVIVNANVSNPLTEGNLHIGGVLGHNKSANITMTNIVFGGTMSNNGSFAGGLVGWSDSSTINLTDCLFSGEYTGSGTFHPIACKNGENTVTATVTRVYYTTPGSGALGSNNVTNDGVRVYTSQIDDKVNIHIVAANGVTYYIPTKVIGLYSNYNNVTGAAFTPNFSVVGEDGTALEAGIDYTVEYSPNIIADEGEYTVTLTGIGGHSGTYTATFTLLGAIEYVDANGTAQTPITDYTVINPNSASLPSGWYVAAGDITATSRLTVTGNVNIILCDGATLTAEKGIRVDNGNSLTIWAQEEGTGKLIATNEYSHAAIGSVANVACGTITINGGVIRAKGGNNGAGIGGGQGGNGGSITINGGTVHAIAGVEAAGIGGGYGAAGGTITINGGNITADGSSQGAGIGGGNNGNGGIIIINGGTITAQGAAGAGIGGGNRSYAGTITINGGTIHASASRQGAGIGMGQNPSSNSVASTVSITGGVITANSVYGSGIGHGQDPNGKSITVTTGNTNRASFVSVTASSVSGTVTLASDLTDGMTVYPAGAVADPSVLNGKTVTSCVSTESARSETGTLLINTYHILEDAALIVVWYDEDDNMLSNDMVSEIGATVSVPVNTLADHAKILVWENLDSMRPLWKGESVSFEKK